MARQRSNIYGFLASVYRQEVNADLLHQVKDPQFLGVLSDLGIHLTSDFLQKPEEELLDDLAVEFAGLFLGPGGHISPHESVHHQRDGVESGMLWGEITGKVKKFIESAGLDYDPDYTGLPDHISVELEFMEALARHEEQAWSEDDDEEAFRCLDMERRFLDEHLSRWVPAFCDKVMAAAELPFYRELAGLTKRFIEFEREEVEGYVDDSI